MLKSIDKPIDGVPFTIGGEVYTAPPLTLGGIKAVLPRLNGNAAEVLSVVLCVALKRNYPDASQPWLDGAMSGPEFVASTGPLGELMRLSGLRPAGAATGAGEATAAA